MLATGPVIAVALLAGCGDDGDTTTSAVDEPGGQSPAVSRSAPDRSTRYEAAAEQTVDGYLLALASGDEGACRYLTVEFMGRISRANENTYSDPDIWRTLCESHARDLTRSGDLTLSWETPTVRHASSVRATAQADATLMDAESGYEEESSPREATATSTYHLVRTGGRWRIVDITEDWFREYGGDEITDPIGVDFGGNLVLLRGCETPEKSYCEPLIQDR